MIQEYLWNGFVLRQPEGWFRLGTDSVACAWFARFSHGSRVADLGCGSGALALMLLASDPTLQLTGIELDFKVDETEITATCSVNTLGKTGVEMEAITGVSVALLTVWDMVKAVEKDDDGQYPDTRISDIKVIKKEKI